MRRPAAFGTLLGLGCALVGCSSYDAPTLTVSSVVLADRSDEAVVLDVTLDAENTNTVELPLETVEYTVLVDGRVVFEGTRSAEATLRREGTQQVVLPVAIRLDRDVPLDGEYPYRIRGKLTYVTPGEIAQLLFDAGVRRPKVSFSQRGTVDFSD